MDDSAAARGAENQALPELTPGTVVVEKGEIHSEGHYCRSSVVVVCVIVVVIEVMSDHFTRPLQSTGTDSTSSKPQFRPVIRTILWYVFPAVAYAALTYGALLATKATTTPCLSYFTLLPPYNLSPNKVGLLSLGPLSVSSLPAFSSPR